MITICFVSHSEQIVDGIMDLMREMAPDVAITGTGGINGEIGTSIDDITDMLNAVDGEAIVFYDIGSSKMNIEMVMEMNDYHGIHLAHYPIVEGGFVASVESSLGKSVEEIFDSLEAQFSVKR